MSFFSVVSFFKGHMGVPYGGFPEDVRRLVLGENPPPPAPPTASEDDSFDDVRTALAKKLKREPSTGDVLSYRLYPKVFLEYVQHRETFGNLEFLTTPVFFYGLEQGQEIETDLEPGKTLIISLQGLSEPDENGMRTVFFDLNGFPRSLEIKDQAFGGAKALRPQADPLSELHVGAAMPGKVLQVAVKAGQAVKRGETLLVTESMKMEYVITAKLDATVKRVTVAAGEMVEGGDLLVELG